MLNLQINIFALNEEHAIERVIQGVPASIEGVARIRIVVIDDGSTDSTAERARAAGATVISHSRNRGLGAVFRTGLVDALDSDAEIMVTIDGDGQFDSSQIPELIGPILRGDSDMTTCSRFADPALLPKMPAVKRWGNHVIARMVSRMTGQRLRDVSCGFRAYNRNCLVRLNLMGRFTYTHETIMELVFKGMRIVEVPLAVRGVREFGESRVASNLFHYGFQTLRIMVGTLLNHRPHHFFAMLALISSVLGVILAVVGLIQFFATGYFLKWAMFTAAFLIGLAALLVLFAFQARVTHRNQFLLENILADMRSRPRNTPPAP